MQYCCTASKGNKAGTVIFAIVPPFPIGRGVKGHFCGKRPWIYFEELTRDQMARVVGATREEVVLMNGLSVNLHLGLVRAWAALGKSTGRCA